MCQFELQATDSEGTGLVKKPTRILTNLPPLGSALNRQCQGGHRHVHLMNGRAKGAAAYTKEFCVAICQALSVYLEYLDEAQSGASFMVEEGELCQVGSDMCDDSEIIPLTFDEFGWCLDDVHGGELSLDLVREARKQEIDGFNDRRVYVVRPRWECESSGGRVQ